MALRRHAPRGAGMAAAGGFSLTTAHRMIDRIHGDAPDLRPPAEPSLPARLAEAQVFRINVTDLADGGPAFQEDLSDLSGRKPDLGITRFLGHKLSVGAGRADQLPSPPNLKLHVVNQGSQRNILQGNGITGLDIGLFTADDRITHGHLGRGDDVPLLTVGIVQQGDPLRPVGIVFNGGDPRLNIILVSPEIDQPVTPLVPAADVAARHPAVAVASTGFLQGP